MSTHAPLEQDKPVLRSILVSFNRDLVQARLGSSATWFRRGFVQARLRSSAASFKRGHGKIADMETFAAAILAGGASRRMGTPKALLPFSPSWEKDSGEDQDEVVVAPLIAHIADVLRPLFGSIVVVTASPEIAAACDLPQVEDRFPGKGPMAGIHAALSHFNLRDNVSNANLDCAVSAHDSEATPVFCVACDMPHLRADFISYLLEQWRDCDAVVPRRGVYDEPLYALYGNACLPRIERELRRDHVGPIDNIFRDLRVRWIEESEARRFDPELRLFDNWNTPDDVKKSRGQ